MGGLRWLRLSCLIIAVGVAAMISTHAVHTQGASCYISLPEGDMQGAHVGGACAFLGVPFAASTAGSLRWKPPQPAPAWTPSVFNATTGTAMCPQINNSGQLVGSEDCLKLNVWTSHIRPTMLAPVIVWFHTGGFGQTSANFAASNGRRMAEETGALVVAANYRLGAFGFLAHAALAAEDPAYSSSGNYGVLDQRAALEWVRDHIAAFGGNPDNVTIAGTSAGSLSVSLHLVSPASEGLFDRAIMQSGFASYRWRSSEEAQEQGRAFAAAIGCADPSQVVTCMRGQSRDVDRPSRLSRTSEDPLDLRSQRAEFQRASRVLRVGEVAREQTEPPAVDELDSPEVEQDMRSLEVMLRKCSTRAGLQKAFKPDRRIRGRELHRYHEGPRNERSGLGRLASVVRGQPGG
jgi:carboxylesterase type B